MFLLSQSANISAIPGTLEVLKRPSSESSFPSEETQ